MRPLADADWNQLNESIRNLLHEALADPASFEAEANARATTFMDILAEEIVEEFHSLIESFMGLDAANHQHRLSELAGRFRTMEQHRLELEIRHLKAELEVADGALAERLQLRAKVGQMRIDELEKYVLMRSPGWEFAEQLLSDLRRVGADKGHKPASQPAQNNCAPNVPGSTDGDWWRIHGG